MGSVSAYLEVESPAQHCYDWWRPLTHLPQILPDVRQVEATSPDVTHWKVAGPAGADIEWDAEIVDDEPGRKVAWRSIVPDGGSSNSVPNGGAVRFDDHGGRTGVEVSLHYDPPGGSLGEAVATLFADPQTKVEDALAEFKKLMETQPSP